MGGGWANELGTAGAVCILAFGFWGCGDHATDSSSLTGDPRVDGGGSDAGTPDGGVADGGAADGGAADGGSHDGGADDGGSRPDGGTDGGVDGGVDGGTPDGGIIFGGPGPWPITNTTYGAASGILESPVVGFTTDETQNRWLATHDAIYLLKPGESIFQRYSASDGLHLPSNPVAYCDAQLPGGDHACPIYGAAFGPGILEIVGGGPNEVFVGYAGNVEGPGDWFDENRHSGKLDRVRLRPDGTLQVNRIDMASGAHGGQYWHNRSVFRMVYDHFNHPHELYVGTNHGVDLMRPDHYRAPLPGEWFDTSNLEYMADHLHPRVCYHAPCDSSESNQRMGGWRGLSLSPDGQLWVAGAFGAGKIRWDPELLHWFMRPGEQAYSITFGDPYPMPPNDEGFINEPVFRPPQEGDRVSCSAVSVAPDGKVWFSSATYYTGDVAYGVAAWTGRSFHHYDPQAEIGMLEQPVSDLIALPDGRLVLSAPHTGLMFWNPSTGQGQRYQVAQGLPDDRVLRMYLDTMVNPPALYVSTLGGGAVLRPLP